MKEKSVLAVIVVLVCYCLSFGNGKHDIGEARKFLHRCYYGLNYYSKNPNTLPDRSTLHRFLNEVNDEQMTWQSWLQEYTEYTPEKLSNPPGSFKSEDELKFATEYHLWLTGWYFVRFLTLDEAAKLDCHVNNGYPDRELCRNAASTAFKHSKHHNDLYTQFYQALAENVRQDIMQKLSFPNYVDLEKQNDQSVENDAFSDVRFYLEKQLQRLWGKKTSADSFSLRKISSIKIFMERRKMTLKENFISKLSKFLPVEDFSLPPDKASRSDKEFLEVAWLLNQYRSLWYEIRRDEFMKFLQHRKQGLKEKFIQRVEEAIEFNSNLCRHYESLYKDYFRLLENHRPDRIVIAQNNPSQSHVMSKNTPESEDDRFEQLNCREYLQNARSNSNHQKGVIEASKGVLSHLKNLIKRLLVKKKSFDPNSVNKIRSIQTFLTPNRMTPGEDFMSDISDWFPVADVSLTPDKASRGDREFLEVAWLLNAYRSLWYEQRCNDFMKCLEHYKQDLKVDFIRRVEDAIGSTSSLSQHYESLYNDYYSVFEEHQQNPGSEDDLFQQIHCGGKRKRETLKKIVSQGNDETAEHESLEEYLQNVRAKRPILDAPDALNVGAMEVDCQTEEETFHRGKRYKGQEAHIQPGHQPEQNEVLDECPSDFNRPTADPSNENEQATPPMEVFQHSTVVVPVESDLRFDGNLGQVETGIKDYDMAMAHLPYIGALRNHQPYRSTTNEGAFAETARVTKVNQHDIAQKEVNKTGFEKETSHDYTSADEEFLEALLQSAPTNLCQAFFENSKPHDLIARNQGPSSASIVTMEHLQPGSPLVFDETDASRIEEQEKLLGLNEIQEDEFHRWLQNNLQPDFKHQTPESSEVYEIQTFSQDGTGASNSKISKKTVNEFFGERQGRVEWITNIAPNIA